MQHSLVVYRYRGISNLALVFSWYIITTCLIHVGVLRGMMRNEIHTRLKAGVYIEKIKVTHGLFPQGRQGLPYIRDA